HQARLKIKTTPMAKWRQSMRGSNRFELKPLPEYTENRKLQRRPKQKSSTSSTWTVQCRAAAGPPAHRPKCCTTDKLNIRFTSFVVCTRIVTNDLLVSPTSKSVVLFVPEKITLPPVSETSCTATSKWNTPR